MKGGPGSKFSMEGEQDTDVSIGDKVIKEEELDSDDALLARLNADYPDSNSSDGSTLPTSRRGIIGRRHGPQPKRKAEDELSNNANTKRSRQRLESFTEQETQVEMAKKVDIAAIGYALRKYKVSAEGPAASEEERNAQEQILRQQVTIKRIAEGKHASVLAHQYRIQHKVHTVVYVAGLMPIYRTVRSELVQLFRKHNTLIQCCRYSSGAIDIAFPIKDAERGTIQRLVNI